MAVTNRYDTFKKYSKEQINAMKNMLYSYVTTVNKEHPIFFKSLGMLSTDIQNTIDTWTKQSADYYKAFGSNMLEGSNVGVDSASVSVNEVPVDRTDPILDTTGTPKRKKRGDGSASALGL